MKNEAHAILKRAIADHREVLLKDRLSCLGILRDFGGRDHSEISLLADAVEQQIFYCLMNAHPVTDDVINQISNDFSQSNSLKLEDARFAVEAWADALSLYDFDSSKYEDPINGGSGGEQEWPENPPEPQWNYYEDGVQLGPVPESALRGLIHSRKITPSTLVRCDGMSQWKPAEEIFADAFSTLPPTTFKCECPNCAKSLELPLHLHNTDTKCPNCSMTFRAGQASFPPLGGIRRLTFIGMTVVVSSIIFLFVPESIKFFNPDNPTLEWWWKLSPIIFASLLMALIYDRIKNTGESPFPSMIASLLMIIAPLLVYAYFFPKGHPLSLSFSFLILMICYPLAILPLYPCLFYQEGYSRTNKMDKKGEMATLLLGAIILISFVCMPFLSEYLLSDP